MKPFKAGQGLHHLTMTNNKPSLEDQIATGETAPLYMLIGEDDEEKLDLVNSFTKMIDEELHVFNIDRFFGSEIKVDQLVDAASMFPMMAPRRIVIVLHAQHLLVPKRDTKSSEREQAKLEQFLLNPPAHATVIFVCDSWNRSRKLVKLILKKKLAVIISCGAVESIYDAERWLARKAESLKIKIEKAAVSALANRIGLEISQLRAGLERMALYVSNGAPITSDDVCEVIAITPQGRENFGITNAIQRHDSLDALRQLTLALDAGTMPFMLLGQIRFAAETLPANEIGGGVTAVLRTDLALKSSGGNPRVLLERLVVELCAQPKP